MIISSVHISYKITSVVTQILTVFTRTSARNIANWWRTFLCVNYFFRYPYAKITQMTLWRSMYTNTSLISLEWLIVWEDIKMMEIIENNSSICQLEVDQWNFDYVDRKPVQAATRTITVNTKIPKDQFEFKWKIYMIR